MLPLVRNSTGPPQAIIAVSLSGSNTQAQFCLSFLAAPLVFMLINVIECGLIAAADWRQHLDVAQLCLQTSAAVL